MVFFNLKTNLISTTNLPLGDTGMIKKAAKAVPANKIAVRPMCSPGESYPFGGDYIHKKSQGIPIYDDESMGPGLIGVPISDSDSDFALFEIATITARIEDMLRFGCGGVYTVTPKTLFEVLPSRGTKGTTTSTTAGYFSGKRLSAADE
jgi:hypothetical protein